MTCKKILKGLFGKLMLTPLFLEGHQCSYLTPVPEGEIKLECWPLLKYHFDRHEYRFMRRTE